MRVGRGISAAIATHEALTTGIHGVGANEVASDADIATHAAIADAHHVSEGAFEGTVADWQANAATGTWTNPQYINDGETVNGCYPTVVGQYCEINYGKIISVNQFRHFGHPAFAGDGRVKLMCWDLVAHAWVDWVTDIPPETTGNWTDWDSSGGEIITSKIRLVSVVLDTGPDGGVWKEFEVKYA